MACSGVLAGGGGGGRWTMVPHGRTGRGRGRPQFVGQTKPVRQYSLPSRAILAYCCRASARQHTILDGTSLRAPSLVDQLESRFFVFVCQQFGGLRKLITLAGRTGSSDRKMHMCFFHILQNIHNLTLKQSTNYGNCYPREH